MIKKSFSFFLFLTIALFSSTSCSETNEEEGEYANWQNRNEAYFEDIYNTATTKIAAGATDWKVVKNWSYNSAVATKSVNHIVMQVLTDGSGTATPFYTDSVKIQYQARLIPSTTYTQGFVFDGTYTGTYQAATAAIVKRPLSGNYTIGTSTITIPDGVVTALMNMNVGDRARVYIPYQLGYGTTTHSAFSVPAYSTLIYDIALVAFARAGTPL